jgi:hypothetical protein
MLFFKNGKIVVSVKVKNTGKVTGKEVVQLYIRDLIGSVTRPVKELKEMIELKANETKEITLVSITKQLNFILLIISGKRNQEILMSLLVVVQQKHCRWIFNILTK